MHNLWENSFKLNWCKSTKINKQTVKAEGLFNFELPSLKESEISKYRLFDLFSFLFYQWCFQVTFIFDSNVIGYWCHFVYNDVTHNSVTCSLMLFHVTENRYVKCPVHFFCWNIFYSLRYEQNLFFLTNTGRMAGKQMSIKKIKL